MHNVSLCFPNTLYNDGDRLGKIQVDTMLFFLSRVRDFLIFVIICEVRFFCGSQGVELR